MLAPSATPTPNPPQPQPHLNPNPTSTPTPTQPQPQPHLNPNPNPPHINQQECFPYISRRLLSDDDPRVRQALRDVLYGGKQRLDVERWVG